MFKKSLILLGAALVALSSCDKPTTSSNFGLDHYKFEQKQYTAKSMNIQLVEHKSRADLHSAYSKLVNKKAIGEDRELAAFTQIKYRDGVATCIVHLVDPAVKYEPEFAGHEFLHCAYGEFHPTQP